MILGVGQVSDTCFMILQGEVQVRLDDGTYIETLKPGGVFNYQGFLNTVNEGKESVFEVYAKDNVLPYISSSTEYIKYNNAKW